MLSLDPRMSLDEIEENVETYDLNGIGKVVSREDFNHLVRRLRSEERLRQMFEDLNDKKSNQIDETCNRLRRLLGHEE